MQQRDRERLPLGAQIRALRTARKLSQEALAERLDVSRQAVTRWESGAARPSTEHLLQIAACLDVPLEELTGTAPPAPPERETAAGTFCAPLALAALCLAGLAAWGWLRSWQTRVPAGVIGYADAPTELWVQGTPWPLWLLTALAVLCAALAVRSLLRARRERGEGR